MAPSRLMALSATAVILGGCFVGQADLVSVEGALVVGSADDGGVVGSGGGLGGAVGGGLGGALGGGAGGGVGGAAGSGGASGGGTGGGNGGATGGSTGGGAGGAVDAGTADPCATKTCQANARCLTGPVRCECLPGYVANGGACVANQPGNPALRTQAEVCSAWKAGHVENAANGGFTKTAATCDPGSLSRDGLDDALRRLNMHRWLAGLGPTTDDASNDDRAQKCALVSAWNPAGPSAHFPQSSATCYTPEGASGAGSSNIAWGCGTAASAIDQWLVDWGNETTYGHRRWLLNPPLSDVGIGLYQGGNNYGSASCITVFSGGGSGPSPSYVAYPPPGYAPLEIAQWEWTVQGNLPSGTLTATVQAASSGTSLAVTVEALQGNYGWSSAVHLVRSGWTPQAGERYHVTLSGSSGTPIEYEVLPVGCP